MNTVERPFSKKEGKIFRKELRRELEDIRKQTLAHRPRWCPRFIWVRIVAIVLKAAR